MDGHEVSRYMPTALYGFFQRFSSLGQQLERRPNTIGRICLWYGLSYTLCSTPTSAMGRDNHRRIDLAQCFNCLWNDGLEQCSCQMKSSQHGINLLNSCLRTCLV